MPLQRIRQKPFRGGAARGISDRRRRFRLASKPRYTCRMNGATLHAIFDVAAWCAAGAAAWWLSRVRRLQFPSQSFELPYIAALVFGAGLGAYVFGTLNL